MKNLFKLFGIAVFATVIGFSFVSCDSGGGGGKSNNNSNNNDNNNNNNNSNSGGTFTMTDIPEQYNGKYAMLMGLKDTMSIGGFQNINSTGIATLIPISNGSVSLPMWVNSVGWVRYSGNDTFDEMKTVVYIFNTSTMSQNPESFVGINYLNQVTFSNGSTTKSWNDGVLKY